MIFGLLARIKGYAAAAIGGALFLIFAYFRARQDGKNAAEAEQAKKQAKAIQKKKVSDEEVDGMSDDRRRGELNKWLRDK